MRTIKRLLIVICSVLTVVSFTSCQKRVEKLLLGGSGWNKIVIIDKNSKQIEWEHPLENGWECNSVVYTPNGAVLFSYGKGAKLITLDHRELWNISVPEGCEMQTARLLPNGNFLLGWVGHPAVIMEVNPKGDILSRTEYETGIENPHAQFRQLNKNKRGNYLMPLFETAEIREITPAGALFSSVKLEGTPFTTLQLDNGHYWVACGDSHSLLEVNLENGEVVRRFDEHAFKGARLFFVAGLLRTSSNGLYICNWQGHDSEAQKEHSPQLFEIDGKGQIVWELNDNQKFGMISTVDMVN